MKSRTWFLALAIALALRVTLAQATIGDLEIVRSVVKDPKSASLQKDRLVGKRYRGTITVFDVVQSDSRKEPKIEVDDFTIGNANGALDVNVKLCFQVNDLDKGVQLRKGHEVTVTAKLSRMWVKSSGFVNSPDTERVEFVETMIDKVNPTNSTAKHERL